jgi:TIR domain
MMPSDEAAGIFISYRRMDASWPTRWLADRLARHFGPDLVFQDVGSIRPGDDFARRIEAAVGACRVLLAVSWTRMADCRRRDRATAR